MGFVRLQWWRTPSGDVLAQHRLTGEWPGHQQVSSDASAEYRTHSSPKWWNVSPLHFRPESPGFWRNCRSQLRDSRNSGLTRQIRVSHLAVDATSTES